VNSGVIPREIRGPSVPPKLDSWLKPPARRCGCYKRRLPSPPSNLTYVKPSPLPLGARAGSSVLAELREQAVLVPTHSLYNSPGWPVRKPNGKWRLTVDYRRLNVNTGPLTAAVPNAAELISTVQEHAPPILAATGVKDVFFMVRLQPEDQSRFAFTREGQQDYSRRLPQGYRHSS